MTALNFNRGLSNWTQGTASVSNGSATVTFSGAALIGSDPVNPSTQIYVAGEGDIFIIPGIGSASIKSVDSAAQITLDYPWPYAAQNAAAYRIRRYNELRTGEIAKYIQSAQTIGQDANPFATLAADDSTARLKLRAVGGKPQIAIGATGAADGALLAALQMDPATGAASFPSGIVLPSTGIRNRLINGAFDIWQRGTSFNVANNAGAYSADRWTCWDALGVAATIAKVAAPTGFLGASALNIQATGASVGGQFALIQRLESFALRDLDGAVCCVSFDLSASTSAGVLTGNLWFQPNSATDNNTYATYNSGSVFTIPVGAKRVTVPLTAAQTAGISKGAQLNINFTQTVGVGNPNITIGAVQLEKGVVDNPFEYRPISAEIRLCQRYYEISGHVHMISSATTLRFATTKRAPPTMVLTQVAGATVSVRSGYVGVDGFGPTASGACDFTWTANAEL